MALSNADKLSIWTDFIAKQPGVIATYDQETLRQAAVATDTWITANQASFVSYLQANAATFAANSTAAQKTLMFVVVLLRRQGLI